jgi:ribosomal protein L11
MSEKYPIKIIVPAGEAKSGPPLGPILGQHQINLMEFCKEFNKLTSSYKPGIPLAVKVIKSRDNKFKMKISQPSLSFFVSQLQLKYKDLKSIPYSIFFDVIRSVSLSLNNDFKKDSKLLFGFLNSKN